MSAGLALADLGSAMLRRLDPETAHRIAVSSVGLLPGRAPADDPVLKTRIGRLELTNPIGLAAGFDKDGRALHGLARLGFGFVECGSVTPRPQPGNPRPRLFRLTEDHAVINRMGFNNDGLDAFADRLARRPARAVIGANLGANKDSEDRTADYVTGLNRVSALADYVVVNVSSPNTPGLRALQAGAALDELLDRLAQARAPGGPPLFLKIAPDLDAAEIGQVVGAARARGIDALIVSNTTLDRPDTLRSPDRAEAGGLSGAPLAPRARASLAVAVEAAEGRLPLIAVGGIGSGEEAYARLRMGASAVQIYSALVFEGPGLVARIKRDLVERLRADGFTSAADAVGARR